MDRARVWHWVERQAARGVTIAYSQQSQSTQKKKIENKHFTLLTAVVYETHALGQARQRLLKKEISELRKTRTSWFLNGPPGALGRVLIRYFLFVGPTEYNI